MSNFFKSNFFKRIIKIKEQLDFLKIDAFFTNHRPSFMYLSGFTGSTGILLITRDKNYLIVDGRYSLRAANEVNQYIEVIEATDKTRIIDKSIEILRELKAKKIGIEQNNLKVQDYLCLSEHFKIVEFSYLVEWIRAVKDEEEIQKIKKAISITEKVLKEAVDKLFNGVDKITELEVANFIKNRIFELGGTSIAFEPIVAFGKNTAFPHYSPSNNILREGDFVIIDMGAVFEFYHSDITRSFCIGKNKEFYKLYEIVLEAQEKAIDSIKESINSFHPYNVALEVFKKYNLEDKFKHGLGHGVGLEIHELPSLSLNSSGYLSNHNVVTVEPGLYIPEVGGIRIEDMIIIENQKANILTSFEKDLNKVIYT